MSVIGPRPALWNQDVLIAEREKYNAKVLLEKTLQPTYIVSKTEKTEQEILQSMKSSNMTLIQRNPC